MNSTFNYYQPPGHYVSNLVFLLPNSARQGSAKF